MNYIDIVLAVLLILAAFRGFYKGFVAEVASLAALVLGVWGAIHFSHFTADYIVETFSYQSDHLGLVSFLVTFLVIVILVHLVGKAIETIISAVALGFINRLAGILFGVIKSALILSVLLLIFDEVDENVKILPKDVKEESQMYEPVKNLLPTLFPFLNLGDVDEGLFEPQKQKEHEKMV
ncbi:CvpA family protein [uncultured Sunxiuqinia sp.]|uniref:CvpA family protein n=1 Tax=uncultured Sunxiuqinia sp. TaxID=1573825 RepID=UPI0026085227|nr:CvpA family protein [uncultured Sunxiuqinia sp.]